MRITRRFLIINMILAILYIVWWLIPGHVGNLWLYNFLLIGEVYHLLVASLFWHTIWPGERKDLNFFLKRDDFYPSVDIFITVAGEPEDVVKKTVLAAKSIKYPNSKVYILNDGFVSNKSNWRDIELLATDIGVECITRTVGGGAKAGNINNALSQTFSDIVVIFDADMVPYQNFLENVIPYFSDPSVGFVQTPQYYANFSKNDITAGAWEQQELFFQTIMVGKDKTNSAFLCGTNVAIRRICLNDVRGLNEENIAEDFLTSLAIHQHGWKSVYLSKVLSEGLSPEDPLSYVKQQLRWARGSLEVLFGYNPLFKRGMSWSQKIEYLGSALYYLNGVVVFIDMIMPILFLIFGILAISSLTTFFAVFFLPFMFASLYTLNKASEGKVTFRAISFSQSLWFIQIMALLSITFGMKIEFFVTPKKKQAGNFLYLAYPHMIYIILIVIGSVLALFRWGFTPSVATNISWGVFNAILFIPFIKACGNWDLFYDLRHKSLVSNVKSTETVVEEV